MQWKSRALAVGLSAAVWWSPGWHHDLADPADRPARAAAVATFMAVAWLTEAWPMAWVAAVPLFAWPLLGIFPEDGLARAAWPYVDAYVAMFLGGMVLGAAMEACGLHRRVALGVMDTVGGTPRRVLAGILLATAGVSMWISNTATAVMMLPIALAVVVKLEALAARALPAFAAALLLAVAYGSNVGGIGTKIGTGTNSILVGYLSSAMGTEMTFLSYLAIGLPFVLLLLPVVFWALWRHARADAEHIPSAGVLIAAERRSLGAMSRSEVVVAVAFALGALGWITADFTRPWWAEAAPGPWSGAALKTKHVEAGVGLALAAGLTLVGRAGVAEWRGLPWSTLVLLGGSFSMAAGIEGSGLGVRLATLASGLGDAPLLAQTTAAAAFGVGLSAVASNTATVNVLLPVLPQTVPVATTLAMAASCDFALPAGTPPNAIVVGSGRVPVPVMMRVGVALDIAAVALAAVFGAVWIA